MATGGVELGGKASHIRHGQVLQCLSMGAGLSQKEWCSWFSSKALKCVSWLFLMTTD